MGIRLTPGTRIGSYDITAYMGTGGEGDVYEALTPHKRKVVLKQHNFNASDPDRAVETERVLRLRHLVGKRSPHVCEIFDVLECDELLYVVMEYVEGESLESVLEKKGRLAPVVMMPIARGVLAGLSWLHGLDLVHRDIKPGNIMVKGDKAKLIDLDIALHGRLTRVTRGFTGVGTYQYAPVEVIKGKDADIDGRADLYALGATLFEALTGHLPFPETSIDALVTRICTPERPSMRAHVPALPVALDEYVQRLMSLFPADRPPTAEQALAELNEAFASERATDVTDMPEPTPKPDDGLESVRAPVVRPTGSACLRIDSGELIGTLIPVPRRGICLGRNLLNPGDASISRFHVRAIRKKKGVLLRDLGSINGLVTLERRVRKAFLQPGDQVMVGATVLTHV